MKHEDTQTNANARAERLAQRPKQNSPLPGSVGAVDERCRRVAFEEGLARFALAKPRGFRDLVRRIARDLLNAVDRSYGADR
jgi:hypothetical protein